MNESKMEQKGRIRKLDFDFEKSTVCIARREPEDGNVNSTLNLILLNIFHLDATQIKECNDRMNEDGKRILVGPYIRDIAKTLVYQTTCFLNSTDDNNYVAYIKED